MDTTERAIDGYDGAGNWVSTTDPLGNVRTAVYDGANRLIAQVDPLGNAVSFAYDAAGNRVSRAEK